MIPDFHLSQDYPLFGMPMIGTKRGDIHLGDTVDVVLKKDQATGKLTRGIVKEILTGSSFHPHGIKVRLADGKVGRVKAIHPKEKAPIPDKSPSPSKPS